MFCADTARSCGNQIAPNAVSRLPQFLRSPIEAVSNRIDSMKMTALGAWAVDELGRHGADTVEISWAHGSPCIEVSASFMGEGYMARSVDIARRDSAVMTAVSQIIDDRTEARFYAIRVDGRQSEPWWHVLGVSMDADRPQIDVAYRSLARLAHPDLGGSDGEMARLNLAKEAAVAAFH